MPDWLVEGRTVIYLPLALAFLTSTFLWTRTRQRWAAIASAVLGGLLFGYFLLDRAVESDREQIARKLHEITTAVSNRDYTGAFSHVSDSFQRGGVNKVGFRKYVDQRRQNEFVTDVQVWDIAVPDLSRESKRALAECFFKVRGSFGETPPGSFSRVTFTLDPDGQWRVQNFDWFISITDSKTPMPVPGWGG